MKADERDRHDLHTGLEEVLGPDRAATLMAHLSPVAWPDVATKRDLEDLSRKLMTEIQASADRVRAELANQMTIQTRTMIFALLMAVFTVASVVGSLAFAIR